MATVQKYTPEMVSAMTTQYVASPTRETVEALAKTYALGVRQVIGKLSSLGVYKLPERKAVASTTVANTKNAMAEAICSVLGVTDAAMIESLGKANKKVLAVIFAALANSKPI